MSQSGSEYAVRAFAGAAAIPAGTPVTINGAGDTVSATTGDTDKVFGVTIRELTSEDQAAGVKVPVQMDGIVEVLADGSGTAIDPGDDLMAGAGKMVIHAGGTGDVFAAKALDPADADGVLIRAKLYPYQPASA